MRKPSENTCWAMDALPTPPEFDGGDPVIRSSPKGISRDTCRGARDVLGTVSPLPLEEYRGLKVTAKRCARDPIPTESGSLQRSK